MSEYASIVDIIDYLHESVFPQVSGLPQVNDDGDVINLLKYEPRSIQTSPTLYTLLDRFDAFLLTGGNPYYLRSLMKVTGADEMIRDLVESGAVYAGASASAVVAGPTLRHFDELDDPAEAEEVIWDGLSLTNIVVAPHVDNPDFGEGCRKSGDRCEREGYTVQRLTDAQALVIDGDRQHVV